MESYYRAFYSFRAPLPTRLPRSSPSSPSPPYVHPRDCNHRAFRRWCLANAGHSTRASNIFARARKGYAYAQLLRTMFTLSWSGETERNGINIIKINRKARAGDCLRVARGLCYINSLPRWRWTMRVTRLITRLKIEPSFVRVCARARDPSIRDNCSLLVKLLGSVILRSGS